MYYQQGSFKFSTFETENDLALCPSCSSSLDEIENNLICSVCDFGTSMKNVSGGDDQLIEDIKGVVESLGDSPEAPELEEIISELERTNPSKITKENLASFVELFHKDDFSREDIELGSKKEAIALAVEKAIDNARGDPKTKHLAGRIARIAHQIELPGTENKTRTCWGQFAKLDGISLVSYVGNNAARFQNAVRAWINCAGLEPEDALERVYKSAQDEQCKYAELNYLLTKNVLCRLGCPPQENPVVPSDYTEEEKEKNIETLKDMGILPPESEPEDFPSTEEHLEKREEEKVEGQGKQQGKVLQEETKA